ncbi:MAG: glycerophosphodiester phosphodiesterase [Acidobacteria bacterium]|nr:glycerophosphodiester phosphodiesterase [Acidobacteriota bacterium]
MALVYAHRGGAALRPENTIAAFDHGLSVGADGLEFDVQLSSDGVVVVHHDDTLERTTKGTGRVADHTAAELGALSVPTLADVLARYPDAALIIEMKVNGIELARRVVGELRKARAIDRSALGSFYSRPLAEARTLEPSLKTGASKPETRRALYRSWIGWPVKSAVFQQFQVPERSGMTPIVTPRFVRHAHEAGVLVKVWTVNDADDMRRLLDWGVDALITDRPYIAVPIVLGRR